MSWKSELSPRNMVLYVLGIECGGFLSVVDIQEKVLQKFQHRIAKKTVNKAIKQAQYVSGNIEVKTIRRNRFKHPVRVFSITIQPDDQ